MPDRPETERPHVIGRARFGRITIANSDAGGGAYTDSAIDQGHRAVMELAASLEEMPLFAVKFTSDGGILNDDLICAKWNYAEKRLVIPTNSLFSVAIDGANLALCRTVLRRRRAG